MKQLFRAFLFFLFTSIQTNNLFATGQYEDLLIINNDTVSIHSNPLEVYFEKRGYRRIGNTELYENCTALWRGYVATWKLENDSLFLIRVQTDYCENPKDVDISKEFGSNRVFANWVNQALVRPQGALLQYVHMGYMSIYEEESYYTFKNGKLKNIKSKTYLERDDRYILPNEGKLMDTLRKMILRSIDPTERATLNEDSSCAIVITFNEERNLAEVGLGNGKEPTTLIEKVVLQNSIEALKGFPKLMKVNHKNYHPPSFRIFFSGHCLKFPYDREYGCNYE